MKTWPPSIGRSAAARSGDGSRTTPTLDLIYYGTGNPGRGTRTCGPATTSGRAASSRATPDTGEAVWYYQWSPHDLFDHDGINECMLLDLTIDGASRAQGARAPGPHRLHVRDRPRDTKGMQIRNIIPR